MLRNLSVGTKLVAILLAPLLVGKDARPHPLLERARRETRDRAAG